MTDDMIKLVLATLTPEQKQALVDQLVGDVTEDLTKSSDRIPAETEKVVYKPKTRQAVVNEDFSVTPIDNPKGHRTPVKAKSNQWTDTGESRDEDFDASKYENMGRAPRTRESPDIVDIECHVCKGTFSANVNTLFGTFHRCGRCIGR